MTRLLRTNNSAILLILRVVLGLVMFTHGAQKVLAWFGGPGFEGTMNMFTQAFGIPAAFAFLAITAEFAGSIGLIVGLLTRIAAFGIFSIMLVGIGKVHLHNGLFMNWTGKQRGEGFEYHLLVIAITLVLMMAGGGKLSVDRAITEKSSVR